MHETESLYDQPLYNATVYRRDLTVKDEEFWYPVAQNINVLESIAYWAASGRGAGRTVTDDGLDHFNSSALIWLEEMQAIATDLDGKVIPPEPGKDLEETHGWLHHSENDEKGALEHVPDDPKARLVRVYPHVLTKPMNRYSVQELQDIVDHATDFYTVWTHPEPLEYTPEAVSEYVTKTFALTPGRDRLEIVEAPQTENTTPMMLMQLKLQMMMQGESAELGREYLTLEIMYKHHEFLPEDQRF